MDWGQGDDPYIYRLVKNTELGDFLKMAPSPPVGDNYRYDNDGDPGSVGPSGVNLLLYSAGSEYALLLDEKVDKGDGLYQGKISTWGDGSNISWHIADHSRDY